MADEDEIGKDKSSNNEINLSNPSAFKKSTEAGYLTSRDAKKEVTTLKEVAATLKRMSKLLEASII